LEVGYICGTGQEDPPVAIPLKAGRGRGDARSSLQQPPYYGPQTGQAGGKAYKPREEKKKEGFRTASILFRVDPVQELALTEVGKDQVRSSSLFYMNYRNVVEEGKYGRTKKKSVKTDEVPGTAISGTPARFEITTLNQFRLFIG